MKDSNNYSKNNIQRLRGKTAIDSVHKNISLEDERRITKRISDIYGVGIEEAGDIHINYHHDRIRNLLRKRAKKQGMTDIMFEDCIQNLDIIKYAFSISRGELIEIAAGDILFKQLSEMQNESENITEDRYFNFYQ
jgi:predicted RNA-binding protein